MVSDPLIGARVGNYEIVSLLGEGGMARVYRASHPDIGREVAIKVLSAQVAAMPDVVRRFRVEAQAVNKIDHPNIIKIFDFGTLEDGRQFYLMELLAGESLADHIRRIGPMPLGEALAITDAVLDALDAVHRAQIVHRDLKPDNVFLAQSSGHTSVKLLDFGIIKLLGEAAFDKTRTGALLGTPSYMAPEQCEGRQHDIGPRTDIYAVGCMLYQMLSGALPFSAESLGGLLLQHMTETPRPLTERIRGLPLALSQVVASCLAKNPDDRPQTAGLLRQQLRPFVAQGSALAAAETMATQAPGQPYSIQTIASPSQVPPRVTAPSVPSQNSPAPRMTLPMESIPTPRDSGSLPATPNRLPYVVAGLVIVALAAVVIVALVHKSVAVVLHDAAPIDARPPEMERASERWRMGLDAAPPDATPDAAIDAQLQPIDAPADAAPPDGPLTLKQRLEQLDRMCNDHVFPADECKTRRDEIMKSISRP